MTMGERLKEERQRIGVNQTVLAEKCGVTKNTQLAYEKGERSPDTAYLANAALLGLDILYVVTGDATPQVVEGYTAVEDKLVNRYRALPQADQEAIHRIVDAMWELSSKGRE
ncbi:helix-turn-helix domain-containing protein [Pseudomonas lactucae]|uniref:Helix-turn-helix transcriptional regulator n=1 Tax=Pseudomonas lactucae TaxID=2813360 RepID=A0A9X0Y7L9_9PSED|nr:helix-turn-helix transcriptional regulator [Pseudomonas lactucae]MBN2974954.1 helix-turn-helix transcriptional regulator [Pseudomonas lactucae]MBN2986062.1 helix-turn-helix transcriptional regulator [Pseudomonas lactucae]